MRRFIALFILAIAAIALSTAASSAAPPADPQGGEAATAVTYVYWTEVDAGTIRRGAADGSGSPQTCVSGQSNPRGLVIAVELGKMYWVNRDTGQLRRANLDCPATGVQTIGPALVNPDRMALDLVGGKIYWTEKKEGTVTSNRIRRANLDGTNAETILDNSAVSEPVGIAIDRVSNPPRLYWTDLGTDSIRRATLDGGSPQLVRQLAADMNPLEIALDVANNSIYWASGAKAAIYVAPLEGGSPSVWRALGSPRSLVLDLPGNMIYWADQGTKEIRRDTLNATNNQLLFNAGDGVDQPLGVALLYGTAVDCYSLTRTHSGNGANPTASPGSSTGCGTGQYTAGQLINLTAAPAAGSRVPGWSGTNNDASTATTNTVNMPAANHTVSVIYEVIPDSCFSLTRNHTGSGANPTAVPGSSTGCGTGEYTDGQVINLTAAPAAGWRVAGWSGTNNDAGTATTNTVNMPTGAHTVSVIYTEIVIPTAFAFYVPAVLHIPPDGPFCFAGPNEVEDNDGADTANGPLCAPGTFTGLTNDEKDFFMFDAAAGRIFVAVTNFHVPGMQLSLYYQTTSNPPVDFDTEPGDGLDVEVTNGQAGRYYIRVYTNQPDPNETRPYSMQVQFP